MSDRRLEMVMDLVKQGYEVTHAERKPDETIELHNAGIVGASQAIFELLMNHLREGVADV